MKFCVAVAVLSPVNSFFSLSFYLFFPHPITPGIHFFTLLHRSPTVNDVFDKSDFFVDF